MRRRRAARTVPATAALLLGASTLTGCTGADDGSDGPLAGAQQHLEETSGVTLTMTTDTVPKGSDGFLRLEGTATSAPAFEGDARIYVNDIRQKLPMVAVDGAVFARLPFTDRFVEVEPADYGTPDPAELMDPEHGIAGWLGATTDVEETDAGAKGQVPGDVVAQLIGSADPDGTFEATYELDDDRLRRAEVTGPFYGDNPTTYTIEVEDYDVTEDITRP